MKNSIKSFSILILALLFNNCSTKPLMPPERIEGIPVSAVWHGGRDGGYWFDVTEIKSGPIYRIKIYNDVTGKLLWNNNYKIEDSCKELLSKIDNIQDVIEYQNDNKIYLKFSIENKRCYLYPISAE